MSRVFIPMIYVKIPTKGIYHPSDSFFKVSIGNENDDLVFKIQLVVDGKIRPRLTVSYDYESKQFELVEKAYQFLSNYYQNQLLKIDVAVTNQLTDVDLTEKFYN